MLVIGQCNRTVDMSRLCNGQHVSFACAVVVHFPKLTVVFFLL